MITDRVGSLMNPRLPKLVWSRVGLGVFLWWGCSTAFPPSVLLAESSQGNGGAGSAPAARKENCLRIALVQPEPCPDRQQNLENGEAFCRRAKAAGADIVLFPEMYGLGYFTDIDFDNPQAVQRWRAMAMTREDPFLEHFQQLARELELAIVMTYLENDDGDLRNSAVLFDRHGKRLLNYSKVHTCRFFQMEGSLIAGQEFFVQELDTRLGPVRVGVMICYDREFPESARALMLKGAELVLTPNACGLDSLRMNQFQVRAWENAFVAVMANYANGQGNGRSCAFNADGEEITVAPEGEPGIFYADIDIRQAREVRKRTYWGDAWRRPDTYGALMSTNVAEPFLRRDAFGRPNRSHTRP